MNSNTIGVAVPSLWKRCRGSSSRTSAHGILSLHAACDAKSANLDESADQLAGPQRGTNHVYAGMNRLGHIIPAIPDKCRIAVAQPHRAQPAHDASRDVDPHENPRTAAETQVVVKAARRCRSMCGVSGGCSHPGLQATDGWSAVETTVWTTSIVVPDPSRQDSDPRI